MPLNNIVSVIIPTYNRSRFLPDALNSVLNQKVPKGWEIEVIVVDDGSTDNTKSIIKPYLNRIKYIVIPHSGKPAVPRNVGINASKGNLIAFQDSDDLWAPNKLIDQIKLFSDKNTILSYGNAELIDNDGVKLNKLVTTKDVLKNGEKFESLLKANVISTLTVIVRKAALIEAGLFDEEDSLRTVEDYNMWLKITALYPNKIKCLKDTLAYYRVHQNNISNSITSKEIKDEKHNESINSIAVKRLISVFENLLDFKPIPTKLKLLTEIEIIEKYSVLGNILNQDSPNSIPKISVIMSVYNGGKFLKPAVRSILDQSFKDYEFIIINDGSTDNSSKIIRSFTDPRVKLIEQSNSGLVSSLNKAIKVSRAKILARMDADDISLPKRLENEYLILSKNNNVGLVSTFLGYIDENGIDKITHTVLSPTLDTDIKRLMLLDNPIGHGAAMFRKECVVEAGYYRDNYGPTEDYDLWRRFDKKWKFAIIPEVLYLYRINPLSISHKNNKIQNEYANKIRQELWGDISMLPTKNYIKILKDARYYKKSKQHAKQIYKLYTKNQIDIAWELLQRGHILNGYSTALAALTLNPKSIKKLGTPMLNAFQKRIYKGLKK